MAAYISFQPSDFFSPTLYTGTASELAITGVGFQPDMTWIKSRSSVLNHYLYDTVRGATKNLAPNDTDAEGTTAEGLKSWQSDGFTLGTSGGENGSSVTYVSWNWKMGTTSGLTGGTITPSAYSLNTTAGQSVIAYTGTGSAATLPHGLGVTPGLIMCKRLNGGDNWWVHVKSMTGPQYLVLNGTGAVATATAVWNDTLPTSTLFSIGTDAGINASGGTYIAYCFAPIKGYSKFGVYTGNGNADGPFVNTGFRPAMIIRKKDGTDDWMLVDDKRLGYNPNNAYLFPSGNNAESDLTRIDLLSNGFKLRTTDGGDNASGTDYLYMAFAEFPLVSSNSKAGTAR